MMPGDNPQVSVIIPCFHSEADLPMAVASIDRQSYPRIETIIVSDDGNDYSKKVISSHPVTFTSTGKIGSGPSNAKNIALPLCKGEVIAVLDYDDYLEPDFFARLLPRVMREGVCVTPRKSVHYTSLAALETKGAKHLPKYAARDRLTIDEYCNLPFGWQTIYRRDMLDSPWLTDVMVDPDMILECAIFEKIDYVPFEYYQGYNYRVRPGSVCHSDETPKTIYQEYTLILNRLKDTGDRLQLTENTCKILIPLFEKRIANIRRYEEDKARGTLNYEPQVIGDMLLYPLCA